MSWQTYGLDREAQKLVLEAKILDPDSLNQAYKMRMAVAYGLERFWGEHLRLQDDRDKKANNKSLFWKHTWNSLVEIMAKAGVSIPNDDVDAKNASAVKVMAAKLWDLEMEDQRVAIAVLTQLCDSVVWWTQRYKKK